MDIKDSLTLLWFAEKDDWLQTAFVNQYVYLIKESKKNISNLFLNKESKKKRNFPVLNNCDGHFNTV